MHSKILPSAQPPKTGRVEEGGKEEEGGRGREGARKGDVIVANTCNPALGKQPGQPGLHEALSQKETKKRRQEGEREGQRERGGGSEGEEERGREGERE